MLTIRFYDYADNDIETKRSCNQRHPRFLKKRDKSRHFLAIPGKLDARKAGL
jgi:hypothetical protein